jgi:hypothetical protein
VKLLAKTFILTLLLRFDTTSLLFFSLFVMCTTKPEIYNNSCGGFPFSFPLAVLLCCAWASPRPTYASLF